MDQFLNDIGVHHRASKQIEGSQHRYYIVSHLLHPFRDIDEQDTYVATQAQYHEQDHRDDGDGLLVGLAVVYHL